MADATAQPHMGPGIELMRAGPADTFRDLEIGHESAMQKTLKGPSSGPKNELRRLTSLRKAFTSGEFWQSLPLLSKIFFITSFICGLLVIAFSIQQMASVQLICCCLTSISRRQLRTLTTACNAENKFRAAAHQPCHAGDSAFLLVVCLGCHCIRERL